MSSVGVSARPANPRNNGAGNRNSFSQSFELAPIVLVGGVAAGMSGGIAPVTSFLGQGGSGGLLSSTSTGPAGSTPPPWARFQLIAGGTLIDNQIAHWPLANQAVAANAVITQPLRISLLMISPAHDSVSYTAKQAIMTALQSTLYQHTGQGGWYNVATPSYIYQGCLLTQLRDVSQTPPGGQVQWGWQWDFEQPLITAAAAQGAQNTAMSKISSQTPAGGDPPTSGPAGAAVGKPSSGVGPTLIPAAMSPVAANVTPIASGSGSISISAVSPILPGP
jgi:hypothetical protein